MIGTFPLLFFPYPFAHLPIYPFILLFNLWPIVCFSLPRRHMLLEPGIGMSVNLFKAVTAIHIFMDHIFQHN